MFDFHEKVSGCEKSICIGTDAVAYLFGYPGNPYPNVFATMSQTKTAARYISSWTINYSIYGALSFNTIQAQINACHPIVVGLAYSTIGHMVLLRGWKIDSNSRYVGYFDPTPGKGYMQCTYDAFLSGSYNGLAWRESLVKSSGQS